MKLPTFYRTRRFINSLPGNAQFNAKAIPPVGVFQCFVASALSASYSPVMTVHTITKSLLWINDSLTFNMTLFLSQPNAVGRQNNK